MKKLGYYLVSLVLVFGLVLSACAAPQKPAPAPQRPSAAGPPPTAPQLTREQQLIEGAKKEGEVSFWVGTLPEREKLIGLFQARYPFLKLKPFDIQSTEVVARLSQQAKAGRQTADVLLTSYQMTEIHALGLLAQYDYPNAAGWPDQPAGKPYIRLTVYGKMPVYNTDLVPPAEVPRSWDDLKSPRWAGKTIESFSGRDVALMWAYLWRENDKLNWDRSFAFWGDVIRNTRPMLGTAYNGPVDRVAAGEFALMPEATNSTIMRMIVLGAPLRVPPLGKMPFTGFNLALVKDAPHPNAARLFIDWLATPEGLVPYANSVLHLVVAPEAQGKARANSMLSSMGVVVDVLPDGVFSVENVRKSSDFWVKAVQLK